MDGYGGRDGYIDKGVIESAIAQPGARMWGQYLHEDLAHMAAAYLFHLSASQGFIDGNKRTAAVCASVFLRTNGYMINCPEMDLYDITMRTANGALDKQAIAAWLRPRISPIS